MDYLFLLLDSQFVVTLLAAVAAFAIAIGAIALSGDRMAGLSGHQIARVAFEVVWPQT